MCAGTVCIKLDRNAVWHIKSFRENRHLRKSSLQVSVFIYRKQTFRKDTDPPERQSGKGNKAI